MLILSEPTIPYSAECVAVGQSETPSVVGELEKNPYIDLDAGAVPKYSFVDANSRYQDTAPPSKYLTAEELLKPLATSKDEVLKGFSITEKGELFCTDQEAMDK